MSDDLLDPNCLQTLIAGCKSRERERARERESERERERESERKRLHGVCTRIFCFGLVS